MKRKISHLPLRCSKRQTSSAFSCRRFWLQSKKFAVEILCSHKNSRSSSKKIMRIMKNQNTLKI